MNQEDQLWVSSIVSAETGEPFVHLSVRGRLVQLDVKQAREIGANLMDCASAAEIDATLVRFGKEELNSEEAGVQLVELLRNFRGHYKHKE